MSRATTARFSAPAEPLALALLLGGAALALGLLGDWRVQLGRFQVLMLAAFAPYALAVWRRRRWSVVPHASVFVLATALLMRLLVFATPPTLSDDIYRYLWEG